MDLSSIKLVAADMDGTLLNSKHLLSPAFLPLFYQMKDLCILFSAASGRQFFNLRNMFTSIREDIIFIAENGSYVVYQGKEILVQAMQPEIVKELLIESRKIPNVHTILCGKNKAYVESENEGFLTNLKMYYDEYEMVDDLLKVENDQFLKIAIYDPGGSECNSYQYFKQFKNALQVKVSGVIWLDLSHRLANKGRAIEIIQEKYAIPKQATMVFGDYLNDLEMMHRATFSFAMENAHPEIKKAANYIAKSNDEDGVLIILQQMLNAMK